MPSATKLYNGCSFPAQLITQRRKESNMNKPVKFVVTLAALIMPIFAMATPAVAADTAKVAGEWNLKFESPNGTATPTAIIKQDGEKLTGTYKGRFGESPLTGTITGNAIKFTTDVSTPNGVIAVEYSGTVDGDTMKGTAAFGSMGEAPFTGKRKVADAPAPAPK